MKSNWIIVNGKDYINLVRFSGKTFPSIIYFLSENAILARNDNGKNPSKILKTDDISKEGIIDLCNNISGSMPTDSDIQDFLSRVKKLKGGKNE